MRIFLTNVIYKPIQRVVIVFCVLVVLAAVVVLSGCKTADEKNAAGKQRKVDKKEAADVSVSAAASLKDVLTKLAPDFEKSNNAKLIFNFASSGDLQTQIKQGAPADVFISAGKKQMDALEEKKLINATTRVILLGNDLIVAVSSDSDIKLTKVEDIASIKDIKNIATCNPDDVPVGKYAKQTLETANIWKAVQPKLVLAKDVRQVLTYIESGNADLGFVYISDLKTAQGVKNVLMVPDNYHDPIIYPSAVVTNSEQQELGDEFIKFLRTENASKVFMDFGFKPIAKKIKTK